MAIYNGYSSGDRSRWLQRIFRDKDSIQTKRLFNLCLGKIKNEESGQASIWLLLKKEEICFFINGERTTDRNLLLLIEGSLSARGLRKISIGIIVGSRLKYVQGIVNGIEDRLMSLGYHFDREDFLIEDPPSDAVTDQSGNSLSAQWKEYLNSELSIRAKRSAIF